VDERGMVFIAGGEVLEAGGAPVGVMYLEESGPGLTEEELIEGGIGRVLVMVCPEQPVAIMNRADTATTIISRDLFISKVCLLKHFYLGIYKIL
jgi:hypothetical protein